MRTLRARYPELVVAVQSSPAVQTGLLRTFRPYPVIVDVPNLPLAAAIACKLRSPTRSRAATHGSRSRRTLTRRRSGR